MYYYGLFKKGGTRFNLTTYKPAQDVSSSTIFKVDLTTKGQQSKINAVSSLSQQ